MARFQHVGDAGHLDWDPAPGVWTLATEPCKKSRDHGLLWPACAGLAGGFSWILATHADRDLVFQDCSTQD